MITNYDIQKILNSNEHLQEMLNSMKDVKHGSGTIEIHKYALKELLTEIQALRSII